MLSAVLQVHHFSLLNRIFSLLLSRLLSNQSILSRSSCLCKCLKYKRTPSAAKTSIQKSNAKMNTMDNLVIINHRFLWNIITSSYYFYYIIMLRIMIIVAPSQASLLSPLNIISYNTKINK